MCRLAKSLFISPRRLKTKSFEGVPEFLNAFSIEYLWFGTLLHFASVLLG